MTRRALIWGPAAAALIRAVERSVRAAEESAQALIISTPGVSAYDEALAALTERLQAGGQGFVRANSADAASIERQGAGSEAAVAIGVGALREALRRTDLPVVAAMCLRSQLETAAAEAAPHRPISGVALDIAAADAAVEVRKLFPSVRRLGVLRGRGRGEPRSALQAAVERAGLSLELRECDGPAELVDAFVSMRPDADAVWCPADAELYSATTVKPLILASLKTRLAVVGFSSGIVRAGAAAGLLPDFRAIGERAADLVLAATPPRGRLAIEECPRYRVAVNRRVLRILGLKLGPSDVEAEK